ncbi:MAG TPA: hypothetical protein VG838_11110 [Opitutaceae bacterium]|nr:hypothetical protein [Opitutaceae bacterium]
MNKTLLLIICDFLLLNLLALTRWETAEPSRPRTPSIPEMAASAQTRDQDLVAAMKQSLTDEQASRAQLAQQLSATNSTLAAREQNLAALQTEKTTLSNTLAATQKTAEELNQKVTAATQEASMTKEQLAQLQRELEQRRAEAERQQQALAGLEKQQADSRQKIEGLTVQVKVAEQEKAILRETADTFKQQAQAEREERAKVVANNAQLAQGVGQLAEKSADLTKEIRDNRPINANVLFSDFLANRVTTTFTAIRQSFFGPVTRTREAQTVFVTDGQQVYALLHIADTPFSLIEPPSDWEKFTIEFSKPPAYRSRAPAASFLSLDPRVVAIPVDAAQVSSLGVKVYQTALEPFKFPEAVLISGGGKGYGEVGFKLDASQRGYVQVDNRLFKRLFGDFAPSRGDLVFSKTGELLGIMVNNDYCAVVNNFLPARTIRTGDDVKAQQTSQILGDLTARYQGLPFKLQ